MYEKETHSLEQTSGKTRSAGSKTQKDQDQRAPVEEEADTKGSQTKISARASDNVIFNPTLRQITQKWLSENFDWNLKYLISIRGLLRVIEVVLSFLMVCLLASAGQTMKGATYSGFYSRSSDTFVFVVACTSFINSTVMLVCCLLSKRTDELLLETTYEITYNVVYSSLFIISGLNLLLRVYSRNVAQSEYEKKYGVILTASIFGLVNGALYGISGIWFFLSKKFHSSSDMIV